MHPMQLPNESERRIRRALTSTSESLRAIESLTRTINLTISRFNRPLPYPFESDVAVVDEKQNR